MTTSRYDPRVREQYEQLPYQSRDPLDESKRLVKTWLDDLPMINHYCYAGRQSFRDRFRVLVAGGGTGDGTIFLAEQLRNTNAEIVHLDFSRSSMEIARQRARARGLANITWVNDTLLALPALGLERFDYINCVGVLHHLEEPDAGLFALLSVLKESGSLGIMVYGQYGRTGIYQMQALMRLINQHDTDTNSKIGNVREVMSCLPTTNWYRRGGESYYDNNDDLDSDAGIYDLLLHSQDRAYTVGELYAWFCDHHRLHLEFTDVGRGLSPYLPAMIVGPQQPRFLDRVQTLPQRQQHEIGELLGGDLMTHSFFATHAPASRAPYGNRDYVPFFFHEPVTGAELSALIRQHRHQPFVVNHANTGVKVAVDPGRFSALILNHIDGNRDFGEVFDRVRAEPEIRGLNPTNETLFEDFRPFFELLRAIDRVLLRHRSAVVPACAMV